jgi:hypothetical protein
MITSLQTQALYKLYSQVVRTVGNIAYDAEGNEVSYDLSTVNLQAQKDACKAKAKQLLAASDWSILPDVALINKSNFEAYRAELRELVLNPVVNPTFPTEPTPVWS